MQLPLHGPRVVLRHFTPADAPELAAYRSDPEVARYQSWQVPYPLERAEELIGELIAGGGVRNGSWHSIAVTDAAGVLHGDVAVRLEWDGRAAEIGYTLRPASQGRGLASEAVGVVLGALFEGGVERVHASLHPDNWPSARLLERHGFTHEGTLRRAYWVGDECSDDALYGLLRDEWRAWSGRDRSRPASVELVEVTPGNLRAVCRLTTHRSQERLVAPVVHSLADALVPVVERGRQVVPWYRAVAADGELAGFVMMSERTDAHPDPYLWRLLVDRWHQGRGIGRRILELVIARGRASGAERLLVTWVPGPGSPEPFYLAAGFRPTGELDGDEIVAEYRY